MTILIRFEGLAALPTFNDTEAFFNTVEELVTENKFIVLNNDDIEHFDATKDDTALAIDFREKDYTVVPSEIPQLISFLKSNLTFVELLSDKVSDTASSAKRRTIMISVSQAK